MDHLLNYWEFSISAHHCKSYLLCKLVVVPFKQYLEPLQWVCLSNLPILEHYKVCWNLSQPAHTYFVKNFSKEINSVRVLLLRWFPKFAQSILHRWNTLMWQVGSISAYSLQYDFDSNIYLWRILSRYIKQPTKSHLWRMWPAHHSRRRQYRMSVASPVTAPGLWRRRHSRRIKVVSWKPMYKFN